MVAVLHSEAKKEVLEALMVVTGGLGVKCIGDGEEMVAFWWLWC